MVTNSLSSDWLMSNISVRFGLIKGDSEKKSQYHWQNSSPFTNPCHDYFNPVKQIGTKAAMNILHKLQTSTNHLRHFSGIR